MPGPIPKPEGSLKRPRSRKGKGEQSVVVGTRRPVTIALEPDPHWHDIAKTIFTSVATSGQADYYQDSDWAILYSLCEDISYYKSPSKGVSVNKLTGETHEYEKPRSGQMLQSIMSNLTDLLLTEGQRRRVRMELQEPPVERPDLAGVAENVIYPEAFGGKAA